MVKRLILLLIILLISFNYSSYSQTLQDKESVKYRKARNKMVVEQLMARGIKDERVLSAMRDVKRHMFVPQEYREYAYDDCPLPIGENQTISQPYIVALMTELLELKGDEKVLEIGTGSGYQAAILSELADQVYTIEILESLAESASKRLKRLGYNNVTVKYGNGFLGWQEYSPYDAIIVTCAPKEVPLSLIKQLKDGGRLVIPLGEYFQELKLIRKEDGKIITKNIIPVRFVSMIGEDER